MDSAPSNGRSVLFLLSVFLSFSYSFHSFPPFGRKVNGIGEPVNHDFVSSERLLINVLFYMNITCKLIPELWFRILTTAQCSPNRLNLLQKYSTNETNHSKSVFDVFAFNH